MRNTEIKNKKKRDQAAEDRMVNRLMILFTAAVVLVMALLMIKKSSLYAETYFVMKALPILTIVTGVLAAAALALFIVRRVRRIDDSKKLFSSGVLLTGALILFGLCLTYIPFNRAGGSIPLSVMALIAATALCFIYCFYERDFFFFSLFTAIGAFLMVFGHGPISFSAGIPSAILHIVTLLFPILVIAAAILLQKTNGAVRVGEKKKKVQLLPKNSRYLPFYIGGGVMLTALIVCMFGYGLFPYAIVAFLAAYLVIAILCTVRMI